VREHASPPPAVMSTAPELPLSSSATPSTQRAGPPAREHHAELRESQRTDRNTAVGALLGKRRRFRQSDVDPSRGFRYKGRWRAHGAAKRAPWLGENRGAGRVLPECFRGRRVSAPSSRSRGLPWEDRIPAWCVEDAVGPCPRNRPGKCWVTLVTRTGSAKAIAPPGASRITRPESPR